MDSRVRTLLLAGIMLLCAGAALAQLPMPTSIQYRGFYQVGTAPMAGFYDFRFTLYTAPTGGLQVGKTVFKNNVNVYQGNYTVELDFGPDAFDGSDRWLEIAVRIHVPVVNLPYTILKPRDHILPVAYAQFARTTSDALNAWSLFGNFGTNPTSNFLGTTDNTALEMRVNNLRAMRIEPGVSSPNLLGGFNDNSTLLGVSGAVIAGGGQEDRPNVITDNYCTIGGGVDNKAGLSNFVFDDAMFTTISGGRRNSAVKTASTVGGGLGNDARDEYTTIAGGNNNIAQGNWSTISGGVANTTSGTGATIPGGSRNTAIGNFSFAAGQQAYTAHNGTFVWADSSEPLFPSTATNQFNARATGGFRFVTAVNANGVPTAGVVVAAGASAWSPLSDRNMKANFAEIDAREILRKVVAMPISTWNYKAQAPEIRHIGPMAQDFYTAFRLGEDEKRISTIDADGIALAAIQGLYQLTHEENTKLRAENTALQRQLAALEARLTALEQGARKNR